jgi:glutathione S-transferase
MIKLYYAPGACSFVPHAALEIIKAANGTPFEALPIKLHKGEQRSSEYLAINPNGQVPTLVVDGQPLTQIVAICDYLDRRHPDVGMLPTDPWQRAQALSSLAWINNTVHPTFTHVFMPERFGDGEAVQAEVKRTAMAQYRALLERIEAHVAGLSAFWFGVNPSFHDAYALTLFRWGGFARIDPDTMPAYKAYVARVAASAPIAAAIAREGFKLDVYKRD